MLLHQEEALLEKLGKSSYKESGRPSERVALKFVIYMILHYLIATHAIEPKLVST